MMSDHVNHQIEVLAQALMRDIDRATIQPIGPETKRRLGHALVNTLRSLTENAGGTIEVLLSTLTEEQRAQ